MHIDGTAYIVRFAAYVCIACSLVVASAAVGLKPRQDRNALLDRQKKILSVTGLMKSGERLSATDVIGLFDDNIKTVLVNLEEGAIVPEDEMDVAEFDQQECAKDPDCGSDAPANPSQVKRFPKYAKVYQVIKDGEVDMLVLPIEGMGLWAIMYGFLAVDKDGSTIRGLEYYKHGETPGLGAEVENPIWKNLWPGRKIFDDTGETAIMVKKGVAGPPAQAPHTVDGLAGATLTSNGVSNMITLWMGENGFEAFLKNVSGKGGEA